MSHKRSTGRRVKRRHHGVRPGTHRLISPHDVQMAIEHEDGNKSAAARRLGMSTRTLDRILARMPAAAAAVAPTPPPEPVPLPGGDSGV